MCFIIFVFVYSADDFMRTSTDRASGYVDWSLSSFSVANLLDGLAFPGYASQRLQLYDLEGNRIRNDSGTDYLYLPFVDFDCLLDNVPGLTRSLGFDNRRDPR